MPQLGPAPGFLIHPDHRIEIEPGLSRWQARHGDMVLADSESAMVLREARYAAVVYFPAEAVAFDRLVDSDSVTTCPFKGEAKYYRADVESDDIAWSYPDTYDEVAAIAGYIAFYGGKVRVSEVPDE